MAIRSFLAFELPPGVRGAVKEILDDVRDPELHVKWVKVDSIHLTVVFIGNIRQEEVPEIEEEIKGVCEGYGPFSLSLKGLGVFPNPRRPRVFWVGLDGEIGRMGCLRDDLLGRLKPFGLKEDKRVFRPHLTLGRFRRPERGGSSLNDIISRYEDFRGPDFSLDELVFFKSELKRDGAIHTRLGTYGLKGKK